MRNTRWRDVISTKHGYVIIEWPEKLTAWDCVDLLRYGWILQRRLWRRLRSERRNNTIEHVIRKGVEEPDAAAGGEEGKA